MRSGFYSLFSERNEQQEREKQIEQQPDRENREVIRADPPTVPPHCPCTQRTQMLNKKKNIQTNKTTPPGAVFATVPASCPTAGSSQPPPPGPSQPRSGTQGRAPGCRWRGVQGCTADPNQVCQPCFSHGSRTMPRFLPTCR